MNFGHLGHPDRNWPEDFAHENGQYVNRCIGCLFNFVGHKRRLMCRACREGKESYGVTLLLPKDQSGGGE